MGAPYGPAPLQKCLINCPAPVNFLKGEVKRNDFTMTHERTITFSYTSSQALNFTSTHIHKHKRVPIFVNIFPFKILPSSFPEMLSFPSFLLLLFKFLGCFRCQIQDRINSRFHAPFSPVSIPASAKKMSSLQKQS